MNQTELVVGEGTCLDGMYSEQIQNDVMYDDESNQKSESTPGFGIASVMLALSLSMVVATRKQ